MFVSKSYDWVDVFKLIFAVLIFTLHIPSLGCTGEFTQIVAQYAGRLGVPFFFVASGFFLGKKLSDKTLKVKVIAKSYLKRVGELLVLWLLLYLPIIIIYRRFSEYTEYPLLQEIVFKCPAYLWYLVAIWVGAIPIIFFYRNYKISLCIIAIFLYLIGCTGNSYLFVNEFNQLWEGYMSLFLTTRNGIFFGFPFLLLGSMLYGRKENKHQIHIVLLLFSLILFFIEVYIVRSYFGAAGDCSMYFSLPLVIICIFNIALIKRNTIKKAKMFRELSAWMYLSQFIIILVVKFILYSIGMKDSLIMWLCCVFFSTALFIILKKFFPKILIRFV